MHVVYCGSGWSGFYDALGARLPAWTVLRRLDRSRSLVEELADAEVILPSNCPIDGATMRALPKLRLIQQPAVGIDGIDLKAAAALGIPVCNSTGNNGQSVAETALLLMLMLARRVPEARRAFAAAEIGSPVGTDLFGKTLGIIGSGNSGSRLRAIALGLGMAVAFVNSRSSDEEWQRLYAESDFISVHCPLNEKTRGLLNGAAFSRMKRGVRIINCSRGAILDRAALELALDAGTVGGVGLDTFWREPWDPTEPLFQRDDVVTLPHVGGSSAESFARLAEHIAGNLQRLRDGEPLRCRIV
jgi:phosphoglycerate dehydrogenase-like enzyme